MKHRRLFKLSLAFVFLLCTAFECALPIIPDIPPEVKVTPQRILFDSKGGTVIIYIHANRKAGTWTIADAPNWIQVEPKQGTKSQHVIVKAIENTDIMSRESIITIVSKDDPRTIIILQEGAEGI